MSKNFDVLTGARKTHSSRSLVRAASLHQPSLPQQEAEWLRGLRIIQKHWRWSLAFAIAVSLSVAVVVLLMKPVYAPVARIEVDPPGAEMFSLQSPDSRPDAAEYAETQAENLQSDELALAVIRKLRLGQNNEFTGGPAKTTPVPPAAPASTTSPTEQASLTPAEREALAEFRGSRKVERDSSSWLINVSFAAHDPKLAALITNTLVEQFIETNYRTRHDVIVQSTEWLSHQLDDIRARMQESNRALAEFQRESGITPVSEAHSTFDERMSELNRQLTVAQADRIQLEAWLADLNGDPNAVPQISADPFVQELSRKLASARTDLKQALVNYGVNHPKVKELRAQVAEVQAQLTAQQHRVVSNLKSSYLAAQKRENLLNSQLKGATKQLNQVAQYEALKREAQANEALYNTLFTKVKEAGISAGSKSTNIRWVDRAEVLDAPTRPRRSLDIAAGVIAGLFGGILVAFVREGLNTRARTVDDVRTWTGLSSISPVPLIVAEKGVNPKQLLRAQRGSVESPKVLLLEQPDSPGAEALRGVFTSVHLSRPDHPPHVLLVTSARAAEGKTTIAVNLAITLSRHGSTCIVDADLRKGRIASVFGLSPRYGLANVLERSCSLEDALLPAPDVPNLTLLPGGSATTNPGELICSDAMRGITRALRQQFESVIVDSSPILPFADARAIALLADGIIFVGRSGVTTREAMKRSLELLGDANAAPILGVVLNGVDARSPSYRDHYGY